MIFSYELSISQALWLPACIGLVWVCLMRLTERSVLDISAVIDALKASLRGPIASESAVCCPPQASTSVWSSVHDIIICGFSLSARCHVGAIANWQFLAGT